MVGAGWPRLKTALASVGFVSLTGGVLAVAAARRRWHEAQALPDEFILTLDLEQTTLVEHAPPLRLQSLLGGPTPLPLSKVVDGLAAAGGDARVQGLLALLGGQAGLGLAQLQELRDAVREFK